MYVWSVHLATMLSATQNKADLCVYRERQRKEARVRRENSMNVAGVEYTGVLCTILAHFKFKIMLKK